MRAIRGSGPIAERLRAFVRAHVRPGGVAYGRGNASRLAEHLGVDNGWVTTYTDQPPTTNADLDTALAICQFYNKDLADFRAALPALARPATPDRNWTRSRTLLDMLSSDGLKHAADALAGLARAYPKAPLPARTAPRVETPSVKGRKLGGTRTAAEG